MERGHSAMRRLAPLLVPLAAACAAHAPTPLPASTSTGPPPPIAAARAPAPSPAYRARLVDRRNADTWLDLIVAGVGDDARGMCEIVLRGMTGAGSLVGGAGTRDPLPPPSSGGWLLVGSTDPDKLRISMDLESMRDDGTIDLARVLPDTPFDVRFYGRFASQADCEAIRARYAATPEQRETVRDLERSKLLYEAAGLDKTRVAACRASGDAAPDTCAKATKLAKQFRARIDALPTKPAPPLPVCQPN
jgi:hypothetical protein